MVFFFSLILGFIWAYLLIVGINARDKTVLYRKSNKSRMSSQSKNALLLSKCKFDSVRKSSFTIFEKFFS